MKEYFEILQQEHVLKAKNCVTASVCPLTEIVQPVCTQSSNALGDVLTRSKFVTERKTATMGWTKPIAVSSLNKGISFQYIAFIP